MKVEELAAEVINACEAHGIEYMLTGALACNLYGIPRATKDVDLVLSLAEPRRYADLINSLEAKIEFEAPVRFDTLTWGKRQVGVTRESPPLKIELFELLEDRFVQSCFARETQVPSPEIGLSVWIPLPEDVIVQKLRSGRSKDLDDALAVQNPDTLDMLYIERWCEEHGTQDRLKAALDAIPPL